MATLGYLISFRTYGTWLPGAEGTVDDDHRIHGTPYAPVDAAREAWARRALKHPPIELDAERRFVVDATLREVCTHRGWLLHAPNVRTTHVHAVVTTPTPSTPERVMNDFKTYSTRRMREAGVLALDVEPWAYHGSTHYLNSEESFGRAIQYTLHEQSNPLEMRCPRGWTPANPGRSEPRT